jgi:hypothetical protein
VLREFEPIAAADFFTVEVWTSILRGKRFPIHDRDPLYHVERCHQGIGNRLIEGVPKPSSGPVARLERLGGILSHYYRDAA